jgi:peptidoglycan/xylan/chitin deacetylase (PgdA/CDA1 family)
MPGSFQEARWVGGLFMKRLLSCLFAVFAFCVLLRPAEPPAATPPERHVAITIDDLPAGAANAMSAAAITEMTAKLLATLQQQQIPVVGFVNEDKLYKLGEVDERIKALNMWLDAGFDLGNHTYGHISLNRAGLKDFEESVVRGETVTRLLLAQHKKQLRYFRYPYLDTGRDLQTRRDADAFLVARGYRLAHVTLDAWDWAFARVYDDAKKRGDTTVQQEVANAYLSYSAAVFDYDEKLSRDLIGYEPKQILLLHANQLEADHIGELLELLRKRGYRFITLEDALSDEAYGMPDTYVGEEGTGWLERWAITRGRAPQGAPVFPPAIAERSKALATPPSPAPVSGAAKP